jgi:hypothetical protein
MSCNARQEDLDFLTLFFEVVSQPYCQAPQGVEPHEVIMSQWIAREIVPLETNFLQFLAAQNWAQAIVRYCFFALD